METLYTVIYILLANLLTAAFVGLMYLIDTPEDNIYHE